MVSYNTTIIKTEITDRQKELLYFIYEHTRDSGYSPTFEEMREALGVSSNQAIIDLLEKLERKELIKKDSVARSIKILHAGYKAIGESPLIAFLGMTTAGTPLEAVEISGEWETMSSSDVAQLKGEVFILKVSGDSMIEAGIEDDDLVLVKAQKEFSSGDIVLAKVGDGKTIKRFISEDKPPYVYLKPENKNYKIIPFNDDIVLEGKVISVLKNGQWKPVK